MKQYAVYIKTESGDEDILFVKHPQKPTREEMQEYLIRIDYDTYESEFGKETCANAELIVEIGDFDYVAFKL